MTSAPSPPGPRRRGTAERLENAHDALRALVVLTAMAATLTTIAQLVAGPGPLGALAVATLACACAGAAAAKRIVRAGVTDLRSLADRVRSRDLALVALIEHADRGVVGAAVDRVLEMHDASDLDATARAIAAAAARDLDELAGSVACPAS